MSRLRVARVEQLPSLNVPGNAIEPRANPSGSAVAWRDADARVLVRLTNGEVNVFRGNRFAWASDDALFIADNRLRAIRRVAVESGEASHVAAVPADVQFIAAGPDGRLAFAARAMVYVTGGPHPMMEGAAQTNAFPFWSPDGHLANLMISEHSAEIVVRGERVYNGPRSVPPHQPSFSPDGSRIATFLDSHLLAIVDLESSHRTELSMHEAAVGSLAWTEALGIEVLSGAKIWRIHLEEVEPPKGWSKYAIALGHIDGIEAEMRRIGLWQEAPLPPDAMAFTEAFGMDTMAFPQWLQFVFVPRVREICESEGAFPGSSQVSVQAVREFDGLWEADRLQSLLSAFDDWINRKSPVYTG